MDFKFSHQMGFDPSNAHPHLLCSSVYRNNKSPAPIKCYEHGQAKNGTGSHKTPSCERFDHIKYKANVCLRVNPMTSCSLARKIQSQTMSFKTDTVLDFADLNIQHQQNTLIFHSNQNPAAKRQSIRNTLSTPHEPIVSIGTHLCTHSVGNPYIQRSSFKRTRFNLHLSQLQCQII